MLAERLIKQTTNQVRLSNDVMDIVVSLLTLHESLASVYAPWLSDEDTPVVRLVAELRETTITRFCEIADLLLVPSYAERFTHGRGKEQGI